MSFESPKNMPIEIFDLIILFTYGKNLKLLNNFVKATIYETKHLQVPPKWKLYLLDGEINWTLMLKDVTSKQSTTPINLSAASQSIVYSTYISFQSDIKL